MKTSQRQIERMKLRLELLDSKADYLSVTDMMEIFGKSRTTIYRHERDAIDGFPPSIKIAGEKCWYKSTVSMYLQNRLNIAIRRTKLVQVHYSAPAPVPPSGLKPLRRLARDPAMPH